MEFYYFGGNFGGNQISNLEKHHFSGVMFTYDSTQGDMFVRIAKDIKLEENIKYLVAIRPYTISPQYLCMINQSIDEIDKNRLQINLISGYIKDHEIDFGGILGDINDSSSRIERSNYLIDYVKTLNTMPGNSNKDRQLDFYVSTTNEYIAAVVKENNNKVILPYRDYKNGLWTVITETQGQTLSNKTVDLNVQNVMVAITPILRKTQEELDALVDHTLRPVWKKGEKPAQVTDAAYLTYEQFDDLVVELKKNGINQLLMNSYPLSEREILIKFIKEYSELKGYTKSNPSLEK
jgi:hypothetical protein